MIAPLIIAGCGVSMTFPAGQNSVVGAVPPEAVGKAAGTNSTLRELGGVFGIALLVAVFAGNGGYESPAAFVDGFAPALARHRRACRSWARWSGSRYPGSAGCHGSASMSCVHATSCQAPNLKPMRR